MPTNRTKDISYMSKDFDSIKSDLIAYVKRYFPNEFQDFNDASGGMAILDLMAYVGDILSYNIDKQVNETFINRAIETKNIVNLAQAYGYKPRKTTPSITNLSLTSVVTTSTSADQLTVIQKGSKVFTNLNPVVSFEILEDVDFSDARRRTYKESGGTSTITVSGVSAVAGSSKKFQYSINDPVKFLKIRLPDRNVTEIVSVSATDGSEYFQVDSLAVDTVFTGDVNTDPSTTSSAEYIMRLKKVPKRFVQELDADGNTVIRFGTGVLTEDADEDMIPNPEDFVLPPTLRGSPSGFTAAAIDSTNFLKTKTLGVAPSNTIITVDYRVAGGGVETNVGPNTLEVWADKRVTFKTNLRTTNEALAVTTENNITVSNPEQASGGEAGETPANIRINAVNNINSQMRAVTLQDYQARTMAMPQQFGSVFRSYAVKNNSGHGARIYTICRNSDSNLINTPGVVTNNISTYLNRFKSFSDTIEISSGSIANIGIDFSVIIDPSANAPQSLMAAIIELKKRFAINRTNFNDNIATSDVMASIQAIDGINAIESFKVVNKTAADNEGSRTYSGFNFDINANTFSGIISFPQNVVWEMKYPNFDIVARYTGGTSAPGSGGGTGGGY
tara:strand:- start:93 stop:1943 length:1851 start_codon:yes stop_codon:yes gene_type:complete